MNAYLIYRRRKLIKILLHQNMSVEKPYQPSKDEIEKAKSKMTERQEILSNTMEDVILKHENKGVSLELLKKCQLKFTIESTPSIDGPSHYRKIAGEIDGHDVILRCEKGDVGEFIYTGSVDDNELDNATARELYDKYEGVAKAQNDISNELDIKEMSLDVDEKIVKEKSVIDHLLRL